MAFNLSSHSIEGSSCVTTLSISLESSRSESTCAGLGGAPSAILDTTPVARPYGGKSFGSANAKVPCVPPDNVRPAGRCSPPETVAGRDKRLAFWACARAAPLVAAFADPPSPLPVRLRSDA